MSISTELNLETAIGYISKGMGAELERQIKEALMPHAEKVVEETTKQLCKNLKANLTSYRSDMSGDIKVALVIDGAQHEF